MLKSPSTTDTATAVTRLREDRRTFYLSKYNNIAHYVSAKAGIQFQLKDNGLLYYISPIRNERLVIPRALYNNIFKLVHNRLNHGGYSRTLDRLKDTVYIRHVGKYLRVYLTHYPDYKLYQIVRHVPYSSLNLIITPAIPFYILTMDFIVELPDIRSITVLLTITNKFTKKVILIPGKDTYGSEDWANILVTELISKDQGIPSFIISNRDRKFILSFWKVIFAKLKVEIIILTIYYL